MSPHSHMPAPYANLDLRISEAVVMVKKTSPTNRYNKYSIFRHLAVATQKSSDHSSLLLDHVQPFLPLRAT